MTAVCVYKQDVSKALPLQKEIHALQPIFTRAFLIAQEVALRFKLSNKIPRGANVRFEVSKEFLVCVLGRDFPGVSAETPQGLDERNILNLIRFIQGPSFKPFFYINPDQVCLMNKEVEINPTLFSNQISYRIATGRFIVKEIPEILKKRSCFDYAIFKAGYCIEEFSKFLMSTRKVVTYEDYIKYLEIKGRKVAKLPFQPKDIIVYFKDERNIIHAACVAKNIKCVFTKFGNGIAFAYYHYLEETPPHYAGNYFKIYRAF